MPSRKSSNINTHGTECMLLILVLPNNNGSSTCMIRSSNSRIVVCGVPYRWFYPLHAPSTWPIATLSGIQYVRGLFIYKLISSRSSKYIIK